MAQPNLIQVIMPPLVAKWDIISDDDERLIPLLECMQQMAVALQDGFLPYCEVSSSF